MTLEPETWYCKNCPLTHDDCGEFSKDSDSFRSIYMVHKDHDGWQKGKPEKTNHTSEIEKIFTDKAIELADKGAFTIENLKQSLKEEQTSEPETNSTSLLITKKPIIPNILEHIVEICGKEIKEEDSNIKQIALTFLSSYTNNPMNLRILAPSGEGKTYLVTQIAKLFPEENTVILAKATSQSWKYNFITKKLVENGAGNWQDYDIALKPLEEELEKTKDKDEQDKIKNQIRELHDSACDLVDFTNKTIILVDSQSFELFENIKTTLSHDQENIKSFSVNKSKSGTLQGQKFIIRGFPAVIYCSAKDEQKKDETNEINTRFNTVSLNTNSRKYRKMLDFEAIKSSLPSFIFQQEIISDDEIEELKEIIRTLTSDIKENGEILNPYAQGISSLMKSDAGFRTRQLKILNNNIRMHALANANYRPRIIHEGKKYPIATRDDIENASTLTKEPREIQPYKIKVFNEDIRTAILQHGTKKTLLSGTVQGLTASEIADILTKKGNSTDRQRLQETILKPLSDHGFLEKTRDPENQSRDIYYLSQTYVNQKASIESTLIDVSTLDVSCLDSYVNNYLKQRFENGEITIEDQSGKSIDIESLLEVLHSIDAEHNKTRHESDNIDSSISIGVEST